MTEGKNSICCSWYESCTYYMQCEHLYNENKDLSEDVYRLEQENKELKSEIRLYNCIEKWGTTQCRCACRCLGNEFCEDADKKINAYRSALEEIRIIANDIIKNDVYENSDVKAEKILDKINEVLNHSEG